MDFFFPQCIIICPISFSQCISLEITNISYEGRQEYLPVTKIYEVCQNHAKKQRFLTNFPFHLFKLLKMLLSRIWIGHLRVCCSVKMWTKKSITCITYLNSFRLILQWKRRIWTNLTRISPMCHQSSSQAQYGHLLPTTSLWKHMRYICCFDDYYNDIHI